MKNNRWTPSYGPAYQMSALPASWIQRSQAVVPQGAIQFRNPRLMGLQFSLDSLVDKTRPKLWPVNNTPLLAAKKLVPVARDQIIHPIKNASGKHAKQCQHAPRAMNPLQKEKDGIGPVVERL